MQRKSDKNDPWIRGPHAFLSVRDERALACQIDLSASRDRGHVTPSSNFSSLEFYNSFVFPLKGTENGNLERLEESKASNFNLIIKEQLYETPQRPRVPGFEGLFIFLVEFHP